MKKLSLEHILVGLLLTIFGGIVIHAPLSVGLGVVLPDYALLIKAWKEVLMGLALVLVLICVRRQQQFGALLKDRLLQVILVYAVIHLLCLVLWQGFDASVAGMFIDLRYVLYFALVYVTLRLYPRYRPLFVWTAVGGALVVLVFAVLQVFILPPDILKYLGYSKATIAPYLTVDLNPDYIRINSTLRGPNPVGAYAGVVLALVAAAMVSRNVLTKKWHKVVAVTLIVGAVVAVWASYSRSALVAAVFALLVILAVSVGRKLSRRVWIASVVVTFALIGGLFAIRDSAFVSNVILHENPSGGSAEKSNEGHVDSLYDGTARMIRQPFGAGVGSTGSASLQGDKPIIIENQYLFIAHETGWAGLAVFIGLFSMVLVCLWKRRSDWLALGLFASGLGLAAIGLLLPVWVDDTVSLVWWGLAAVALGGVYSERTRK